MSSSFSLQMGQSIQMPDGMNLNADILLPHGMEAAPVLLTLTPYTTDYAYPMASRYAREGFAVIIVDVRGRGRSEGFFDLYNDGDDGATCVDWVAAQPWCNGNVGLFGGSYAGLNQWAIAARQPAALAALAPVCAPMPGLDADGFNGLFPLYNARWSNFVRGRSLAPKLFADDRFWSLLEREHFAKEGRVEHLLGVIGSDDPVLSQIIRGWEEPDNWITAVPSEDEFARIQQPVLTLTGTADNAQRGALEYRRRHLCARPDAQHWCIVGPWNHTGDRHPAPGSEALETGARASLDTTEWQCLLGFYKWALCGEPLRPAMQEHQTISYIAGTEAWAVPPDTAARREQLQMDSPCQHIQNPQEQIALPTTNPESGFARSLFDVLGGEKAEWSMDEIQADTALIWSSEPLVDAKTLLGTPSFSIDLEVVGGDVDVFALLVEVTTAGRATILSSDARRLAPSAGFETIQFDTFRFAARRIEAETRLSLVIGRIASPSFQRPLHEASSLRIELAHEPALRIDLPLYDPHEVKYVEIN